MREQEKNPPSVTADASAREELSGITVDDILREYGGEEKPPERDLGPLEFGDLAGDEPGEDIEGESLTEEGASVSSPETVPEPEEESGTPAEDILSDVSEVGADNTPGKEKFQKPRERKKRFSRQTVLLLAGMGLALALIGAALIPDLADPAWSILMIAGLTVACVPMALGGLDFFRDRVRSVPTPLVMLASTVIYGASGNLAEATVAAILYNLFHCALESVREQEQSFVRRRLAAFRSDGDGAFEERLDVTVREIDSGRVKPMVEEKRVEWLALLAALAVAAFFSLIPPLFDGFDFLKWLGRGAVVLSVCVFTGEAGALMTYLNGAEAAFANGVWFSGAGVISASAEISSVLFNKTGTLTEGSFKVSHIDPVRLSEEQLLYLAVQAGAYSDHALDRAIRTYSGIIPDKSRILRHSVQEGYGSFVQLDGETIVAVGNIDFMEKLGVRGDMYIPGETCVFVSVGRTCVGRIDFADTIKSDAITLVHDLKNVGVANVALMTGDNALSATNIGRRVGITEVYSDCRPQDKLDRLRYIQETQVKGERAAFVSEAGHDLELLETANLSVTLGVGPEITGTFPDVVISSGELSKFSKTIRIAKDIRRRIAVTFVIAAAVRVITAFLAVTGVVTLWLSAVIMAGLQALSLFNTNIDMD